MRGGHVSSWDLLEDWSIGALPADLSCDREAESPPSGSLERGVETGQIGVRHAQTARPLGYRALPFCEVVVRLPIVSKSNLWAIDLKGLF
jgi:hypothetical protein